MAKRAQKKATKKIERLRNRLIHIDAHPDMKVGWITRYMFVVDNFDIGDTKRANENRWLYTIGPHRRTRYPFETLSIPGTQYTLHWFTQCKVTDEAEEPEFRYVPLPADSVALPPDSTPYVPTVQITQTKGNWKTVSQDIYFSDANVVIPILSSHLNRHNFTIFDARRVANSTQQLKLPLITNEETQIEVSFLEVLSRIPCQSYNADKKRKASEIDNRQTKRARRDPAETTSLTQRFLDLLHTRPYLHFQEASTLLNAKESKVQQIADVLSVVGSVSVSDDGYISIRRPFIAEPPRFNRPVVHTERYNNNGTGMTYPTMGMDPMSSFGFGFPTHSSMEYVDTLGVSDADFGHGSDSSVVLPFAKPSSFLTTLISTSCTSTVSSSSSCESHLDSPRHILDLHSAREERDDDWEDSIWNQ